MVSAWLAVVLLASEVDPAFEHDWALARVRPAPGADPLLVYRRLELGLCGTVPSLEEVRAFEADGGPGQLERAVERLLHDGRFHRRFAEGLARAFVGTHRGAFLVYRRDRFVEWLADELAANRPYDAVVRQMISANGVSTGSGATNFITSAVVDGRVDSAQLAGRTARAALGLRLDCAECHDHPFAEWTKAQFDGLAAFYTGLEAGALGLVQQPPAPGEERAPFGDAWLPTHGAARARLAAWVTDPHNRRFARAAVNRVWELMAGRPLAAPVDDLPLEAGGAALEALADGFTAHGYDLFWLVREIALSRAYGLSSELAAGADRDARERVWAVFPLTALSAEQLVGSLQQAASVGTIDSASPLAVRVLRALREHEFVDEYGEEGGTVPQALLRMNGKLPRALVDAQPFGAVGRIALFAPDDGAVLEALYLAFFTRRPSSAERAALLPLLRGAGPQARAEAAEDVAWALFNSPELAWNH